MNRRHAALLTVLALTSLANAQVTNNQNGKNFHRLNTLALANWPQWPAAASATGDCIWKILPSAGMKNGAGSETLGGLVVPVYPANFTTGTVNIPDVEIRPAVDQGGGCFQPDFAAMSIASVGIGNITLPSAGAYSITVTLSPTSLPSIPNGDSALCYLANDMETATTPDAAQCFVTSGGTDTDANGCGFGKTGTYVPGTMTMGFFGNNVENYLEVAFVEPTVQPVRNRASDNDPGYGAYDFSVGAGGNTLGWHVEAYQEIGNYALPVISFTGATMPFTVGGATVILDPDIFLDSLLVLQQAGLVLSNGSSPPFEDGVFDTYDFPIPLVGGMVGTSCHVAVFFIDVMTLSVTSASNTCSTRFVM
ncbi:MAG: hypothetical protein H6833_11425 [Planctomycetes bacterium]|nr:hypothetical protein [Planctomycetota bacterium]